MAQVHHVAKRRVGKKGEYVLNCTACHQPIEYGQPYKWVKVKRAYGGVKMSFHPACRIQHSHVSTSRLAAIWDAQHDLDFSACESVDDCRSLLEDFASTVRDVEADYRESVENIESGFGHRTFQADELEERAEALEGWADELEAWEPDAEEPEWAPLTGNVTDEQQAEWDEYLDAIRDEADSLAQECPV